MNNKYPQLLVNSQLRYSEGDTTGEWLALQDYEDHTSLLKACYDLYKDEFVPELLFVSTIDLPSCMVSNGSLDEDVYEYLQAIEDLDNNEADAFEWFVAHVCSGWSGAKQTFQYFQASYQGLYASRNASAKVMFSKHLIQENHPIATEVSEYFDHEKHSTDLFLYEYQEYQGHVFSRNY